ncbi:hypothetical protein DHEL01_v205192 [Diaporthe helianthi]|uniref:Uncharacterized protein n=1 Tax=Diaporthe helianthi TaxID=158607 RepID=A0A2P5I1N3_DIAHE|nr:hypothetical protein DHEL01_v205192 [Diaporthe helianthi]
MLKRCIYFVKEDQRQRGSSVDDELADLFSMGSEDELDPSTEGSKNELIEVLAGVGNVIACLLRFSVTIRNPAPHDHFKFRAGLELTLFFKPFDTRHVRDKFPRLDGVLSERLGRLLSYRLLYFECREDHHIRLKQGLEEDLDDGASKRLATTVASSLPQMLKHTQHILVAVNDDLSETSATSCTPSVLGGSDLQVPPIPKQF